MEIGAGVGHFQRRSIIPYCLIGFHRTLRVRLGMPTALQIRFGTLMDSWP